MNAYEITFIVRPDLDEEQTGAVVKQVTGRVESGGGEVIASYAWSPARRRMAYPIRDFGDGYYVTITFRLEAQNIRELETALRLNDRILRFLVVQATDQMIRQSQQRMQQAAAAAAPRPAPAPTVPGAPAPQSGETDGQGSGAPMPVDDAVPSDVVVEDVTTSPGSESITTPVPPTPASVAEE